MRKHNQLKQFVYALFTQEQEKSSYEIRNCLIFNVDQPGLEPGTSRLWGFVISFLIKTIINTLTISLQV